MTRGRTSSTTSTPTPTASAAPSRLVEVLEELADLVAEAVGVGGEAEELRQLADDDGDGEPVHVADLHLAREQVGDEAELAEPEPDLDEPDEQRQHPRERDRPARVVAVTSSGMIAAKISGETDESGPSTSTRDGPKIAYPTRHAIVV